MKLSSIEKKAIALAAKQELARRNYKDFFALAHPELKIYPHVNYIIDKLQKIIDGEQHFYVISTPPQHGKSETITKTFPSYYLMRNPEARVLVTAYSEGLQNEFSRSNRRFFTELAGPLFGLKTSKNTAREFAVADHRGDFYATSMLGSATGRSADLLIIDDPVKNAEEASSPTVKKKLWEEWASTFSTRLQKGASVIVIMTRWETDDLAGRLLQKKSFPWEEIKFPAIAEESDILGRKPGEALCEELHPLEELLAHKHDIGSRKFSALYQQSPTVEGGNTFKTEWIRFYVPDRQTMLSLGLTEKDVSIRPRNLDIMIQAWDATFKSGENNDFVAGQTWAKRGADCYLMPGWCHKRLSFTETLQAIRDQTRIYPQARAKLIEDKANGPAIIDTLKKEIPGIIPVTPDGGKVVRASAVSPMWEAGNVYLPHPLWKPEVEDFIQEIVEFPNGTHDDSVDSMTYALRRLQTAKRTIVRRGFR